jgi:hypothetical protein
MAHRRRESYVEKRVQCILSPIEVHYLLRDLCVKLGFCIPPKAQQQLEANPPAAIDAFVRAVYIAEGMDPDLAEQNLYRQVCELASDAFERAAGNTNA